MQLKCKFVSLSKFTKLICTDLDTMRHHSGLTFTVSSAYFITCLKLTMFTGAQLAGSHCVMVLSNDYDLSFVIVFCSVQEIIPSTENSPLKGDRFVVRDQGALRLNEPYVSTTHKDHHAFSK